MCHVACGLQVPTTHCFVSGRTYSMHNKIAAMGFARRVTIFLGCFGNPQKIGSQALPKLRGLEPGLYVAIIGLNNKNCAYLRSVDEQSSD